MPQPGRLVLSERAQPGKPAYPAGPFFPFFPCHLFSLLAGRLPLSRVSSDQSGHAIVLTPHARKWFVRGPKCASARGTGALTRDRRRPLRQRAERLGTDARGGRPVRVVRRQPAVRTSSIPSRNSCRRFRGLRGLLKVEAAAATRQETRRANSSGPTVTPWRYRSNRDSIPGRSNRPHRPKHSRYRLCRRALA